MMAGHLLLISLLAVDEGAFAVALVGALPLVESLARDTKIAARPRDIAALFSVVEMT
jgi:hypothetical protein